MSFGGGKPSRVEPVVMPPDIEDPAIMEVRRRERERLRKKRGRGASILTGPQGVEEPASIGRKTLLGE